MQVDFSKRRRIGEFKLKKFGILSCEKCANNWKRKLMKQGKKVRLEKVGKVWELWAS